MMLHRLTLLACLALSSPVLAAEEAPDTRFADPLLPEALPAGAGITATDPLALPGGADCLRLAAAAGAAEGLPEGLLPAISLVETGKSDGKGGRMPWPWTLNRGGESHYLDDASAALAKLDEILATGTTNVDVGCMQLNWKWHSKAFSSRADMLDPVRNTAYAARFLKELHSQLGSWELATAAYHSTDPDRGQAYLAKVSSAQETVIALLPTLGDGIPTPAVLLAAIPLRLQGLLALSGAPLFEGAAERAALVSRGGEVDRADEAPAAFAPGEDDPDLPLVTEAPPPATAARPKDRTDLPMVLAESETPLLGREVGPRRLRDQWTDVETMRRLLRSAP